MLRTILLTGTFVKAVADEPQYSVMIGLTRTPMFKRE
jgi:hypothetical protein